MAAELGFDPDTPEPTWRRWRPQLSASTRYTNSRRSQEESTYQKVRIKVEVGGIWYQMPGRILGYVRKTTQSVRKRGSSRAVGIFFAWRNFSAMPP